MINIDVLLNEAATSEIPMYIELDGDFFSRICSEGYDDPEVAEAEARPLRQKGCIVYVRYYGEKWYQFIRV